MEQMPARTLRKRTVSVKFADDVDIHYIATSLSKSRRLEGKENVRTKRAKKIEPSTSSRRRSLRFGQSAGHDGQDDQLNKIDEEVLPEEFTDMPVKPFGLLQDDDELVSVAFQTPKKRKSMTLKAQESANKYFSPYKDGKTATPSKSPSERRLEIGLCTPNRRVSIGGVVGPTPKGDGTPNRSALKRRESLADTPRGRRQYETPEKGEKCTAVIEKTPGRLRVQTRALIQKSLAEHESDDGDFSSDGDSFVPSDGSSESSSDSAMDDDDNDDDDESSVESFVTHVDKTRHLAPTLHSKPSLKRSTRRNAQEDKEYEVSTDAYFENQSAKHITSNNTLSRLKTPRLQQDMLHTLLKDVDAPHHLAMSQLSNYYQSLADQWLFSLWEGYSILLYGVGSKRHILQTLQQEVLSNCNVLLVNGFFPGVTIKNVLEDILTEILEVKEVSSNLLECVDLIENIQSKKHSEPMYLLVHNIDGATFRNDKTQAIFSYLAQIPNIHLIASIDHINAPLLWDQAKLRRFNFVWWDVTTCVAYGAETSYESSLLIQQSGALALSSLNSVFKSLIPNAKKVFVLISKNQLDNAKNQNFSGISFQDLYWKCRAAFLASSDRVLRAQLTEFLDHRLLKQRRGGDGVETLLIPIENGVLSQFLESLEQEEI